MLGWSRSETSKIARISAETIRNIEKGIFIPQSSTVEKIVRVFLDHNVEFFSEHGVILRDKSLQSGEASVQSENGGAPDGAENNEVTV